MTGDHRKHAAAPEPVRLRVIAVALVAPLAVITLVALVLLWPSGDTGPDQAGALEERDARVTTIERAECPEDLPDEVNGCGTATLELEGSGESVEAPLPNGSGAPEIAEGDDVVVVEGQSGFDDGDGGSTLTIVDHQRGAGLWVLAAVFAVVMVLFGRWRGLTSLVGLVATFGALLVFVIPAILDGESPLLVAIVGSAAILLAVLYLTHGFSLTTTVALLGTLASLTLTGLLSAGAVAALHLTGVTDDVAMSLETSYDVDMRGLLLAGIVIGALGVLDDVTVTQAATVRELAEANPVYGTRQLYRAGTRVGRSHIASVVNTIVLAYAGASLPLLVLTVASSGSLGSVVTTQFISQEVVRSLVAALGLVAAVPITTALAAVALRRPEASSH